jgi:teichuronic acid biosynthesis glycosyltransferase TuaG
MSMNGRTKLVSIIIPAYNAAPFLEETIQSLYNQTYINWEAIIVNDGSKDNTASLCDGFTDERVKTIHQANSGVATARNNGLAHAKGEYVIFFDADDIMSPSFIQSRLEVMINNPELGYVGGIVETFPVKAEQRIAAASDPVNEILFFNPSFVTIPSNYLFKKEVLVKNSISFNKELSSTADRFFVLEVSKVAKGANTRDEQGKLLYRITSQSMSNNVNPNLIIDNEKFYYQLKAKNLLPTDKLSKFKSVYFLSLAKGFGIVKYWGRVSKYLVMSFINHPVLFAENMGKSIFRASSFRVLTKEA